MTKFLIIMNILVKLAIAATFASDGDFLAAGAFLVAIPVTTWLIAQ